MAENESLPDLLPRTHETREEERRALHVITLFAIPF